MIKVRINNSPQVGNDKISRITGTGRRGGRYGHRNSSSASQQNNRGNFTEIICRRYENLSGLTNCCRHKYISVPFYIIALITVIFYGVSSYWIVIMSVKCHQKPNCVRFAFLVSMFNFNASTPVLPTLNEEMTSVSE